LVKKFKLREVKIRNGFHSKVKENFDKDETNVGECDINSRTPTWISSDTKWGVR